MPAKRSTDHIVLVGRNLSVCLHCGERYRIGMPCSVNMFSAICKSFCNQHRDCKPRPGGLIDITKPDTPGSMTPLEWIDGLDTGVSSETIYAVMTGEPVSRTDVPHDADDFGRCHRLIKRFPDWKPRLPEVAERFPAWAGLVANWDDLAALAEARSPLLAGKVQELTCERLRRASPGRSVPAGDPLSAKTGDPGDLP